MILPKLLLLIVSLLLSFGFGELYLRTQGYAPGYVPRFIKFRPVSQLEVSEHYLADADGVFKMNVDAEWKAPIRINAEGFRSIPFERDGDARPSVLLLGDSFAWGYSAQPITNCFADILGRSGYRVFNTGISGTSPTQYASLAEKYVPKLKPDIVAVSFYMLNDIRQSFPMFPYKRIFHVTNAGWLQAYDGNGHYMKPKEAYEIYLAKSNELFDYLAKDRPTSAAQRLMFKSAVGTAVWVRLAQLRSRVAPREPGQTASSPFDAPDLEERRRLEKQTTANLQRIERVAEANGARFLLFVIPVNPEIENPGNSLEDNRHVFGDLDPLVPPGLTSADYADLPDDHFNNSGHEKFARFMLEHFSASVAK